MDTHNMDELQRRYAKWKKPDPKGYTHIVGFQLCDISRKGKTLGTAGRPATTKGWGVTVGGLGEFGDDGTAYILIVHENLYNMKICIYSSLWWMVVFIWLYIC